MVETDRLFLGTPGFSRKKLAEVLGISHHTLAEYAKRGVGPKFIIVGRKAFYPEESTEKWAAELLNREN